MEQHKKRIIVLAVAAVALVILIVFLTGMLRGGASAVKEEPVQASAGASAGEDGTAAPESADSEKVTTVELEEDFHIDLGENESIGGF